MNPILAQQEAREAICSALHQSGFEALGNSEDGRVEWFTRGTKPRNVRVSVAMAILNSSVVTTIEWANLHGTEFVKGEKTLTFPTDTSVTDNSIRESAKAAVLMCLEVFRDVLQETGVAGPEGLSKLTFSKTGADSQNEASNLPDSAVEYRHGKRHRS